MWETSNTLMIFEIMYRICVHAIPASDAEEY